MHGIIRLQADQWFEIGCYYQGTGDHSFGGSGRTDLENRITISEL